MPIRFAPFVPQLGPAFGTYAAVPLPITISLGLALGALAGWLGWRAGGPAPRSKAPAAA